MAWTSRSSLPDNAEVVARLVPGENWRFTTSWFRSSAGTNSEPRREPTPRLAAKISAAAPTVSQRWRSTQSSERA